MRKIKIPWFPLSVIIFTIVLMVLWGLEVIPRPEEMISFIELLVERIGIIGIGIATFIEGLAYIGHQFPGMTLILISIIVSSNNLSLVASLVATITIALTLSSVANYYMGAIFSKKPKKKIKAKIKRPNKTFLVSLLHPAFLSLYFFHRGLNKKGLKEIIYVPILIFPYGLIFAYLLSFVSGFIREKVLTEEYFFLTIFIIWFLIEFYMKNKEFAKSLFKKKK